MRKIKKLLRQEKEDKGQVAVNVSVPTETPTEEATETTDTSHLSSANPLPNEDTFESVDDFVKTADNDYLTERYNQWDEAMKKLTPSHRAVCKKDLHNNLKSSLKNLSDEEAVQVAHDKLSDAIRYCVAWS